MCGRGSGMGGDGDANADSACGAVVVVVGVSECVCVWVLWSVVGETLSVELYGGEKATSLPHLHMYSA